MDELFVEAVLYSVGISNPKGYQEVLNTLWESASSELEPILLDLEALKYKGAMDYLLALLEGSTVDEAVFGKHLTKRLRELYELLPLADFAKKAYIVWAHLPQSLRDHDPFYILSYADDCLSYGDEVRCRELLEEVMNYYS